MSVGANVGSPPPGPSTPSTEQLERFNREPFSYLDELHEQYGTLFALQLGAMGNEGLVDIPNNGSWVFLTRPHQLRLMYGSADAVASGASANAIFFGTAEKSVAYIEGEAHRCRRSQVQPPFTGSGDYTTLMVDAIRRRMDSWPSGRPVRLFDELQAFTSEVIVEVVCGNLPERHRAQLRSMLPRTENARYSRDELLAADKEIRAFIQEHLDGHLDRSDELGRDDVMAQLLRYAAAGDRSLAPDVIRDEVFSLLYTGFSTTANTLAWAFVHVLHDPDVHGRVLAELGSDFATGPLKRESFTALPYLEALILETLRLHPVTPLNGVRLLKEPLRIDDHLVPAGSILVHCAHLVQRSAEVFADPLVFQPERFIGTSVDPYAFGPFGGGRRICVGRSYSKEEMKIVLATVLGTLRLELVGGFPGGQPQGFFVAPDNGAPVLVRRRPDAAGSTTAG